MSVTRLREYREQLMDARFSGIRTVRDQNGEEVTYRSQGEIERAIAAIDSEIASLLADRKADRGRRLCPGTSRLAAPGGGRDRRAAPDLLCREPEDLGGRMNRWLALAEEPDEKANPLPDTLTEPDKRGLCPVLSGCRVEKAENEAPRRADPLQGSRDATEDNRS